MVPDGSETVIVLPASPESPPVADTLKPSTYRVRAPAAADGAAIVTAGVVTGAAARIGKGVDATGAGSSLVLASTVRLPTVGGLTIPRRVASRRSPALTVPLLNSVQVVTWMFGAAQLPTSTPRVTSRNVPPFHGPRPESPGSWIRTVSLPLSGAPTVSPTRYTVRAAVAAEGDALSTVTFVTCADDGAATSRNSRSESVEKRTTSRP